MQVMLCGVAIEGGGAEQVIVDLARGLSRAGHTATVVFLEGTDSIVPSLESEGIRCIRLLRRTEFASSPLADFTPGCVLQFRRLFRELRPDVVHGHVPRAALWAAWAKRCFDRARPLVYTEHNVQEVYPAWGRWVAGTFLPAIDHVVCVSEAARQDFVKSCGWQPDRISTVWNGIQPSRMEFTREPRQVREENGVAVAAPLVLNVANLAHRKAQEVLVEALARLRRDMPEIACWIVGSPEIDRAHARLVQDAVSQHGAEGYIRLLGPRRDVPDLMAACDVFVLSSRQEGFGLTILEAMVAGKPVVATDSGGCAEVVAHGETGLIVPPEDPQALADAIRYVLEHPDEARAMGETGRRRVEEHFTVDAMVRKHLEVYEKAIARARRH